MNKKTKKSIISSISLIVLTIMLMFDLVLFLNSVLHFMKAMSVIGIVASNLVLSLISFVCWITSKLI